MALSGFKGGIAFRRFVEKRRLKLFSGLRREGKQGSRTATFAAGVQSDVSNALIPQNDRTFRPQRDNVKARDTRVEDCTLQTFALLRDVAMWYINTFPDRYRRRYVRKFMSAIALTTGDSNNLLLSVQYCGSDCEKRRQWKSSFDSPTQYATQHIIPF